MRRVKIVLQYLIKGKFGADSIAVSYTSVLDKKAVEIFFFDENGKVVKAAGLYC